MNIETLLDTLKFAYRQKLSFYRIVEIFENFSPKKIIASIMLVVELLGSIIFDTPVSPVGTPLDLKGYNLVFCDEFEGDSLNTDVWNHRALGERRGGYNGESQVKVADGNLYITAEYLENGKYGEGWYAGMISLKEHYKQGYFEIRCKCNKDKGFWSAFWIQADHPYDHDISQGGINGAEIDIFEAMCADKKLAAHRNVVTQTVHCNGYDDDPVNIDSCCIGDFKVGRDIYDEYNTYGLKWTEDEYIFYINGVETSRCSFGNGVSQVPEEVIVSLELPAEIPFEKGYTSTMTVDYVKIYQK